ncbi:MAG: hypothetical protein ACI8UO_003745 [Verrucomicrobiales bacterium]|jgi:hypothetical protein
MQIVYIDVTPENHIFFCPVTGHMVYCPEEYDRSPAGVAVFYETGQYFQEFYRDDVEQLWKEYVKAECSEDPEPFIKELKLGNCVCFVFLTEGWGCGRSYYVVDFDYRDEEPADDE